MRLGILIIGSLYWDRSPVRCRWRQARLSGMGDRRVRVPIRYGRKSSKRGNTYTMVFAKSCSEPGKLGTGLVAPACVECGKPEHLLEEAQYLWAAEQDSERVGGICADWGRACILLNPASTPSEAIQKAWQAKIKAAGNAYTVPPTADGEGDILDATTGRALFDWPIDDETQQPLRGFDLLIMTATVPTLTSRQYPAAKEIADAWKEDKLENILYFHNNRKYGITTFEDAQILAVLRG